MNLPPDFRELLEEFAREGVEHAVIGGYAFSFHAEPRVTKDLDLLVEGSPANLERAARALAKYGAPANVVEAIRHLRESEIAYIGQPPLRVDLMRTVVEFQQRQCCRTPCGRTGTASRSASSPSST
jgi:hypothetical protein